MTKWIDAAQSGVRIDAYIAEEIPELSRNAVQKLLEE